MAHDSRRLTRCPECGKLFRAEPGVLVCHACREGQKEKTAGEGPRYVVPEVDRRLAALMAQYEAHSGVIQGEVISAETDPLLHPVEVPESPIDTEHGCELCGKPRLRGSEFCLECQARLLQDLGKASHELFGKIEPHEEPPKPGSMRSIISDMRDDRLVSPNMMNPAGIKSVRPQ